MATNTQSSLNSNLGGSKAFKGGIIVAKVKEVIIDPTTELAKQYGGYDAIGTVFYTKIQNNPKTGHHEKREVPAVDGFAKPLFFFQKQYPLLNEVILIITATSKDAIKSNKGAMQNYYLPPLGIWNHPHHNIFPNPRNFAQKEYTKLGEYKKAGIIRRLSEDEETDIPLGDYFNEIANIKSLLPYEGDTILEGRFGNSIRFGSTSRSDIIPEDLKNPWSNGARGENSDPITIIRNGQRVDANEEGWIHTLEDINLDPSSIYLASNQKIENFLVASDEFGSFGINVTIPKSDQEEAEDAITDPAGFATAEEVEIENTETEDTTEDSESTGTSQESTETSSEDEIIDYDAQQTGSLEEDKTITEEEAFIDEEPKERFYAPIRTGQEPEKIPSSLPSNYRLASKENGAYDGYRQNHCGTCQFYEQVSQYQEGGHCNKWGASVRGKNYREHQRWICNSWEKIKPSPKFKLSSSPGPSQLEQLSSEGFDMEYNPYQTMLTLSDGEKRVIFWYGKKIGPRKQVIAKHSQGDVYFGGKSSGTFEELLNEAKIEIKNMNSEIFKNAVLNGGVGPGK